MIYVLLEEGTHKVNVTNFDPDSLPSDVLEKGYLTNKPYPNFTTTPMKETVIYYNPDTDEFSVTYEDRQLTPDEETQILKTEMKLIQTAIDDLIMGGMM